MAENSFKDLVTHVSCVDCVYFCNECDYGKIGWCCGVGKEKDYHQINFFELGIDDNSDDQF